MTGNPRKQLLTREPTDINEKVTVGAAAAAASGILIWILEASLTIDIPSPVEILIVTLASFAGGYIKKESVIV